MGCYELNMRRDTDFLLYSGWWAHRDGAGHLQQHCVRLTNGVAGYSANPVPPIPAVSIPRTSLIPKSSFQHERKRQCGVQMGCPMQNLILTDSPSMPMVAP